MGTVMKRLRMLVIQRNINVNEVKLTMAVEDFRLERSTNYTIQKSETSTENTAGALVVVGGEIPELDVSLEKVFDNLTLWPNYQIESMLENNLPPSKQSLLKEKSVSSPNVGISRLFGYGSLFVVSSIPVLIAAVTMSILFLNSFNTLQ